jgi:hypothetical protein
VVTKQKSTLHTHLLAKVGKVKEIKFKKYDPNQARQVLIDVSSLISAGHYTQ